MRLDGAAERKVLQVNGSADDVAHVLMCPTDGGVPLAAMRLVERSTRDDVLSVGVASPSDVQTDVVLSEETGCQNITLSFAFEKLAGVTNYTVSAREGVAEAPGDPQDETDDLCSVTLSILVAGISVYTVEPVEAGSTTAVDEAEHVVRAATPDPSNPFGGRVIKAVANPPGTHKVLYTGNGGSFNVSYEHALRQPLFSARAFVQFPDGSDSFSTSTANLNEMLLGVFLTQHHDELTIPVAYNSVSCIPVEWARAGGGGNSSMTSNDECGVAFRESADPVSTAEDGRNIEKLQFRVQFSPYRIGTSKFHLAWDGFANQDVAFEDEEYTNIMDITVAGDPLPVVLSVRDPGPLLRAGGEEIEVEMANTEGSEKREFLVGGVSFSEIPNSYRQSVDGVQVATFLSSAGNGKDLPWLLRVTYPDGAVKVSHMITSEKARTLQYRDDLLKLESVEPPSGKAGDILKLGGSFEGFSLLNVSETLHGVYFNNVSIPLNASTSVINADTTLMEFPLPNRSHIGPFFEYDVRVLVNGQFSNSIPFTFVPDLDMSPSILVLGSSLNKTTQRYEIGSCGPSRFALSLPQGFPAPDEIRWSLFLEEHALRGPSENVDMLDLQSQNETAIDKEVLFLPESAFQNKTGIFRTEVMVVLYGIETVASVLVEKLDVPNIGVTIFQPPPRGINVPNAPLRISSFVDVPDGETCVNASSKVVYEWAVGNETQRFSFANFTETSMESSSTPSRLGREYVVPASNLQYGPLSISLFVFMEDDPEIYGFAEAVAIVQPPELIAMIGNGEAEVTAGIFSDLVVSGERSFDPDSISSQSSESAIDTHTWTCEYSEYYTDAADSESQFIPCSHTLLPDLNAPRLTISKEDLVILRDTIISRRSTEGGLRVKYSLQVGKDFRVSAETTQTIFVRPDPFQVATLSGIEITDNEGNTVDWRTVRYYEGLILLPTGEGKTWKFSVLSPASERNTLLSGAGIINRPGYYAPGSQEVSQDFPLGLHPYALSPGTTYLIEIIVYDNRPGVEQGSSIVSITTLPRPQLVFPSLSISSGDEKTLFSATASVNVDTSYAFLYYYYLINNDGEEFCVDGCSGASYVQFYIELPGQYELRCDLVDSLGKSTLHSATNNATIVVRGSPTNLMASRFARTVSFNNGGVGSVRYSSDENTYGSRLKTLHWSGDHGNLELLVSTMSADLSQSEVLASSEEDFAALERAVTTMHQIMVNSAPSTRASQSYVRTASRLSSINSVYFATEQVMYTILSMVDNAITKVPESEALEIEKDLQMFYNRSIRHVLAAFTGFTSRVRLQQYGSGSGLDARSLVIDTFRLQGIHMTRSATKGAECGMMKTLSTIVSGGVEASAVENEMNNAQIARSRLLQSRSGESGNSADESLQTQYANAAGADVSTHSTLTISVLCNREQGSYLRGDKSTFEWCDSVFDSVPGLRAQSVKYKMDPKSRLIFSMMETMDYVWLSGIGLDQDPSDTQFLVTTNVTSLGENNEVISIPSSGKKNCFTLNTTVSRLGITENRGCLSAAPFRVQSIQVPFEPKVMMKDFQRSDAGMSATISRDNSSTVLLEVDGSGIFGARGAECPMKVQPASYERPSETGNLMAYTVAGIGGVGAVATALSWVSLNALYSRAVPL